MKRSLRIKLILFIVLALLGVFFIYPSLRIWIDTSVTKDEHLDMLHGIFPYSLYPKKERIPVLNLGLDLIGGIHLVLEADTTGQGLTQQELATATDNSLNIIRNRVDELGVAEPSIQRVGRNRVQVQLPGVANRERALEVIGKTGLLEFCFLAEPAATKKVFSDIDAYISGDTTGRARPFSGYLVPAGIDAAVEERNFEALKALADKARLKVPPDEEILFGPPENEEGKQIRRVYVVKKKAQLTGNEIDGKSVKAAPYQGNEPQYSGTWVVEMGLLREGQYKFAEVTGKNVGMRLAIVFDGMVKSAPNIKERIPPGSKATITGQDRTGEESKDLAILIRNGALPIPLRVVEERTVSPTLGRDSIKAGVTAVLIGAAAVIIFMIIYYTGAGLAAVASLIVNIFGLLAVLAGLRATLTLPGLAGIALTIGMAVDANVLIFERIRDELASGKFTRSAVETGYSQAWKVIIDANITTIITAIILFIFNSGAVRGFALTLIVGLIVNMITAVYFSRGIFDAYLFNNPGRKLYI